MNPHKKGEAIVKRRAMLINLPESFTTNELVAELGCSYIQARDHLRYMESDGLVRKGGTVRARVYYKLEKL